MLDGIPEIKILTCQNCNGTTCREVPTTFAYYHIWINKYKIIRDEYKGKKINVIIREYYSRNCKLQPLGIAFELCPSVDIPQGYKSELNSRYRLEYKCKKFTEERIIKKIKNLLEATKKFIDDFLIKQSNPESRINLETQMLEDVSKIVKIKVTSTFDNAKQETHQVGWFGSISIEADHLTKQYKMNIPLNQLDKQDVLHVIRMVAPFLRDKYLIKETI